MRPRERYLLTLSVAILIAILIGVALATLIVVLFHDPSPTLRAGLAEVVEPYRFGSSAAATPWLYAAGILGGLVGFAAGVAWGYALLLALVLFAALAALNPLALVVGAIVIRSWSHFFGHRPHEADVPAEWRTLLTAGVLAFAMFAPALARVAPVAYLPSPAAEPPPTATQQPIITGPSPTALEQSLTTLRAVRDLSQELKAARASGQLLVYPLSERTGSIASFARDFPVAVQQAVTALPLAANVGYWSDGTSFLLFATLPTSFVHPNRVAVEAPAGTVLVRTDNDVLDDLDFDGLTDAEEAALRTSPAVADTDGDGVSDGREVGLSHDPLDPLR